MTEPGTAGPGAGERRPIDARAASLMVVLCAIWGLQQVVIKLGEADMTPLWQIGVRSGIAALIVLALILWRQEHRALGGGAWKPGVLLGALFGLQFVLMGEGLRLTSASHMVVFLFTAPVFAAIGLHLKLPAERMNALQWFGVAAAFAGAVIAFGDGKGQDGPGLGDAAWIGDLMGVAAGAAWAATTLTVRFSRLNDAPPTVTLFYQLAGGCLLGLSAALMLGQTRFNLTPLLLTSLGFQVVFVSTLSLLVWFSLLRTYLASRLGVLSFLTPVFGVAFGVLILGETLEMRFLTGAVLILFGVILVSARDGR